jgi:hypothetical protein
MLIKLISAQVVLISTTIEAKTVALLAKVRPTALALHDEKGNETFKASLSSGNPTLSDYGVTVHEKMDIVINAPKPVTAEDFKRDNFIALTQLSKLEAQVAEALVDFGNAADDIEVQEVA